MHVSTLFLIRISVIPSTFGQYEMDQTAANSPKGLNKTTSIFKTEKTKEIDPWGLDCPPEKSLCIIRTAPPVFQ